jgi:hypothetical protein
MNASELNSTYEYYTLDYILTHFAGSTWATDNFNFWPFVTIGPIATLLSILAFIVLQDPEFDIDLYKYMRVYTVNNALLTLLITFQWLNCCIRIIPWTNSYMGQAVCIYFVVNTANALYFYGSLIDILMILDRIAIFNKFVKSLIKLSPYIICCITFVVMVVVEGPGFLVLVISSESFKLNATTSYIVWYNKNSEFANSRAGTVLTYLVFIIRDVLLGIVQIILNFALVVCFKQYMSKKMAIHSGTTVAPINSTMNSTTGTNAQRKTSDTAGGQTGRVSSADKRATVMCILMCILSMVEHLLVLASVLYPYFSSNLLIAFEIYSVSFLWQLLKRIADFFLLFFINKVFKKVCLKYLHIE